ncbi:unnamed protein product [Dibothriocephalus latus]|uniref:Uncharacterized protein n=1 Tax=Dibothriocephalus latus TaxID=60516 RepID=A0A3P7LMN1_DIBLA|nr:unnamed protein product [Dibothriocephalus latus]
MENVKAPVQEADALFRSVIYNARDTERESVEALKELLNKQRNQVNEQIKAVDRLILDLRDQFNKLREEMSRVPDVSSELAKMEMSMQEWARARNQSVTLAEQLEAETLPTEEHIDKMKQLRGRLRSAIAKHQPAAGEKERVIKMLEDLVNKSMAAIQEAQEAYVARTKAELQEMEAMKEDIKRDLDKLESDVQGIHNQVSKALDEAQALTDAVKRLGEEIDKIKEDVSQTYSSAFCGICVFFQFPHGFFQFFLRE